MLARNRRFKTNKDYYKLHDYKDRVYRHESSDGPSSADASDVHVHSTLEIELVPEVVKVNEYYDLNETLPYTITKKVPRTEYYDETNTYYSHVPTKSYDKIDYIDNEIKAVKSTHKHKKGRAGLHGHNH